MYKLKTSIELPIAHCLYRGAYSGLCCGNVYRDKGQCDGKNDRYDLGDKVLPILHGHNYIITITVESENLSKTSDQTKVKAGINNDVITTINSGEEISLEIVDVVARQELVNAKWNAQEKTGTAMRCA